MPTNVHYNSATHPPTTTSTAGTPKTRKSDIMFETASGLKGTASGDNAVAVGADKKTGVAGVKGEDTAVGAARPGFAFGFGAAVPESPAAGLAGLLF